MRTDILDLHAFYETPLGAAARKFIVGRISEAWGDAAGLRVAGFGYAPPYLDSFARAERVIALAPDSQGVIRWPCGEANRASLVAEYAWPLPDASIDRLVIVHGLEEAGEPRRLMREAWRVLADDGRLIVVAAHRRGLWSMIDGTPFAAGRPYLKRQLDRLLSEAMFQTVAWSGALFFPPFGMKVLLRAANTWERAGMRAWPAFGGVLLAEARKEMLAPVRQGQRARITALRPAARPAPAARVSADPRALMPAQCGAYMRGITKDMAGCS